MSRDQKFSSVFISSILALQPMLTYGKWQAFAQKILLCEYNRTKESIANVMFDTIDHELSKLMSKFICSQ